jgi:deazaflavin-dependent oxidoreductase (nitroreductase family)
MADPASINVRTIAEFRANRGQVGGGFTGAPLLLLHTVGARSGTPRINPMMYLPDAGRYLVFASKAGSDRNPDWYHNLLIHPDARIEVDDEILTVRAVVLQADERDAAFAEQARRYPGFARYQRKTERVIPVISLIPTDEPDSAAPPPAPDHHSLISPPKGTVMTQPQRQALDELPPRPRRADRAGAGRTRSPKRNERATGGTRGGNSVFVAFQRPGIGFQRQRKEDRDDAAHKRRAQSSADPPRRLDAGACGARELRSDLDPVYCHAHFRHPA